jgi:hypothetical protein
MKKIYISKNLLLIKDYCHHGDIKIGSKNWVERGNKNLCPKCSEEIIVSDISKKDSDSEVEALSFLKSRNHLNKEKFKLWYPQTYKEIELINGKYWNQKLYMFLNNFKESPKCECGKEISFDNHKGNFKKQCESCTRKKATYISSNLKSKNKWNKIFHDDFHLDNLKFKNISKLDLEIEIDGIKYAMKKRNILKFKKWGVLFPNNLILSENDIEKWIGEFRKHPEKYYQNVTNEDLKYIQPFIWKSLRILYEQNKETIKNFDEFKFCILNNIDEPPKCGIKKCNCKSSFNHSFKKYNRNCVKHQNMVYASRSENEIIEYLKTIYNGEILTNYRGFGREIDIYLPELSLGIEFNGLYWHSTKFLDKKYHFTKYEFLKNKKINLFFIWEDDWNDSIKQDIIKSMISSKLNKIPIKIDARKCQIREIKNTRNFLNNNHLQGWCQSSKNIGLFYNEELVSLMTFGKRSIYSQNDENIELLRFCNKKFTIVRGASSKIFKYFKEKYKEYNKIVSFSSCDYSSGNMYEILGFKKMGYTVPNYWILKDNKKYHRSNFMKHKICQGDSKKTGEEKIKELGYFKIYGTGNIRWEFEK